MRRRTLAKTLVTHPETGRVMRVNCMTGGGFDVIVVNPARGERRMAWVIAGLFSGGKTGTRMRFVERDVSDLDD